MSCQNCGSDSINPCSCTNGYNAFTLSTANVTIANPMTIPVSNTGQYIGVWARVGQPIFIQGYGTYRVTASTATSISVQFPTGNYVAGATYIPGISDYASIGTLISGAKISPGGAKGADGNNGVSAVIEEVGHGVAINTLAFTNLTPTIVIPANSLDTNGDSLIITAKLFFKYKASTLNGAHFKILCNAANITDINSSGTDLSLLADFPYMLVEVVLTRTGAGTADSSVNISVGSFGWGNYTDEYVLGQIYPLGDYQNLALAIDWTNPVNIDFLGDVNSIDNYLKLGFYCVKNFQQIV